MNTNLPEVINRYQRAHDQRDSHAAITAFAPDATVIGEGHTYVGLERIRGWLDHGASEYTYTRTATSDDSRSHPDHPRARRALDSFAASFAIAARP